MNKRGCLTTLFGLGAVLLICAILFAFNARRIMMWAGGFRNGGDTAEVLQDLAVNQPNMPEPVVDETTANQSDGSLGGSTRLETVTLQSNGQETVVDVSSVGAESAEQVQTADGSSEIIITYNEDKLNELLVQAIVDQAPAETQAQIRNVGVDLVDGAAVVSAEANLGFFWQPFSVILAFNNTSKELEVTGVDINGAFFETPPDGLIGDQLNALEQRANSALDRLSLVSPSGETLSIDQVTIMESEMEIVAR